jgi:uncharacterized cofD-like protein
VVDVTWPHDRDRIDATSLRVVAFGGGTGLPVLLTGLRDRVGGLTAVVTVGDDGGSSGRLRHELGVAPPGDVRNCLVALAGRTRLAEVFDYRFEAGGGGLGDHTVGNIIIAALSDMAGGFCEGIDQAAHFLRAKGRVLPAATRSLTLLLHHADGSITRGESTVRARGEPVCAVSAEPEGVAAPAAVIDAIEEADVVVLGAGSLFTSTIAALLGRGVRDALERFEGPVVYVANLMTQPGETDGFSASDHVRAIGAHVGPVITDVIADGSALPDTLRAHYRAEGAEPVEVDRPALAGLGVRVHEAQLLVQSPSGEARHDPARLGRAVVALVAGPAIR